MIDIDDPPSDFSSDTESDDSAPDEEYLCSRLGVPPSQLLAESHRINKLQIDMKTKVLVASEAQAVFEEEEARAVELAGVARAATEEFNEVRARVDTYPLGQAALPKELHVSFVFVLFCYVLFCFVSFCCCF